MSEVSGSESIKGILEEDLEELFGTIRKRNITAPQALKEFATTTPDGGTWRYIFEGNVTEAKRFVHAFRSELSRVRERMRDIGKPIIPFRLTADYHAIKGGTHKGKILISLHRSAAELEAMQALDKIFDSFEYHQSAQEEQPKQPAPKTNPAQIEQITIRWPGETGDITT